MVSAQPSSYRIVEQHCRPTS